MVLWAVCVAVGVLLSMLVRLPLWLFFALLAAMLVSLRIKTRPLIWLAGGILLLVGMLRGGAAIFPEYRYIPNGEYVQLSGRMAELPYYSKGWYRVKLVDVHIDSQPLGQGVSLSSRQRIDGRAGDLLTNPAMLSYPSQSMRLGMLAQGIGYYAEATDVQVVEMPLLTRFIPARMAGQVRQAVESMYGEQAPLVNGMLLGYKAALDDDTRAAFAATGTSHILAVSGLHMGFIAALAAFFARKLRPGLRFMLVSAFIWLYCLMVGAPTSAVRACLMATCALAGNALGQKNDMLSSLSAAAIIILLINPTQLFSWGFQMSFAAVFGIALFEPVFTRVFAKLPKAIGSSLSISLSAQTGITPVLLRLFGYVQPLSVFANLLIVPMAGIVTVGGLVSAGLYLLSPVVAAPLAWVVQGVARAMRLVAEGFAALPFSTVELGFLSAWGSGLLLLLLLFLSPFFLRKGWRRLPAVFVVAALFLLSILL